MIHDSSEKDAHRDEVGRHRTETSATPGCARPPGGLLDDEVDVEVARCGDCSRWHHDVHAVVHGALIPCHQSTGTVRAVGHRVRGLKIGDQVGIDAHARELIGATSAEGPTSGVRPLDPDASPTAGLRGRMITREQHAFLLPATLDGPSAMRLLCRGECVWDVLTVASIGPGSRVAVISDDRLGVLAAELAESRGADVVVLRSKEMTRLGASIALGWKPGAQPAVNQGHGFFDLILYTRFDGREAAILSTLMAPDGSLFGFREVGDLWIRTADLLAGRHSRCHRHSGKGAAAQFLMFCADHQIMPEPGISTF